MQRGEVTRDEDPRDRRSKLVAVPRTRAAHLRQLIEVRLAGVRRFVEGLEPAEREALAAAVEPIVRRLEP